MDMQKLIARINELYKKSKSAEGLTEDEKKEQEKLRNEYRKAILGQMDGQLSSLKIKNPDGSIVDVKKKEGN